MADETNLIAGVEKRVAIFGGVVGVMAALASVIVSYARIDPAIEANKTAITELRTVVETDRQNVQKEQEQQNARVDRIEETRTVNLQRLSRLEEATAAIKDSLASINSKMDRVLMRR